jgi:hypothetical protein
MSLRQLVTRARRVISKPPWYVARRIWAEIDHTLAGYTQPAFGRRFDTRDLLRRVEAGDSGALWQRLVTNSRGIFPGAVSRAELEELVPG